MNHNIIITQSVYERIRTLQKEKNNTSLMLRIAVTGGGCSGFMYNYSLTNETQNGDIIFVNNNTSVIIDPESISLLEHSKIDFINDLGQSYFKITNPNASIKCGCGNSFGI
jgi:iron-sulfur cluster insertion protein